MIPLVTHNPEALSRPLSRHAGVTVTPVPAADLDPQHRGPVLWDVGDATLPPPPVSSETGLRLVGLRSADLGTDLLHPWLLSGHVGDVPLPLDDTTRKRLYLALGLRSATTSGGEPRLHLGATPATDRLAHAWRIREALNRHLPYLRVGAVPLTHAVWRFGQVLGLDDAGCVELVMGALIMDAPLLTQPASALLADGPLEWRTGVALNASRAAFRRQPLPWLSPWPIALSVVRDRHMPADRASVWGRAVAIVDSYVALCSPRPFRAPCTPGEALGEMTAHAGSQFDTTLLNCFRETMAQHSLVTPPPGVGPWLARAAIPAVSGLAS